MISAGDAVALAAAGVVAGLVGTAGGITSLISYPALLLVGLSPLDAAVTNIVALVVSLPGSAWASGPELRGQGPWIRRWAALALVAGAVGALLLLSTPAGVFARVVPFLLVVAAGALLFQPRLSAWRERRGPPSGGLLLPCGVFATCVYNGYFGAGAGVMTLALLLLTVDQRVTRANALKNVLVGAASVSSALALAFSGRVVWLAVAGLAPGTFVGSTLGPRVARRLPGHLLRVLAASAGLVLAVHLWLDPG